MEFVQKSAGTFLFFEDNGKPTTLLLMRAPDQIHPDQEEGPGGLVEPGETPYEAAIREIWEETGLVVRLNKRFRSVIAYSPYEGVHKTVVFFLAKTKKKKLRLQKDEILNSVWLEYEDALKLLIHHDVGGVLYQAHTFLAEKARSSRS